MVMGAISFFTTIRPPYAKHDGAPNQFTASLGRFGGTTHIVISPYHVKGRISPSLASRRLLCPRIGDDRAFFLARKGPHQLKQPARGRVPLDAGLDEP